MIDVRRLRLLFELSRRGTITAVAEALAYTPSAVSQQLAALAREAGVPLLERAGRRVALTPAGVVLARYAESVLAVLEEASAALAATRSSLTAPLRIVDLRATLHEMRLVKDDEELKFLRRAAQLSAQGHVRAMQAAAPGMWEFEVQAAHDGYCYANGARRMAYRRSSSAGGTGTARRHSSTISSAWTRCTHSSGRSTSLWASAGAAIDLTSSGTTKSRPSSAALARASFISASVPRGLAPTSTLGLARVAATRSTM